MFFKQKEGKKHINPRFRAYGKARLDIAQRAKTRQDWDNLWKGSTHPFPFTWGDSWKQCVEYKVDDFAAEVGFYVDFLGLPVNAFDPAYAMFTSPGGDFFIGVVPTQEKGNSTPPDAIRLQFMVSNILETTKELERRGVVFEQQPQPCQPNSSLYIGYFRTPHGIPVDLWGDIGMNAEADGDDGISDQDLILEISPASDAEESNTETHEPVADEADEARLPDEVEDDHEEDLGEDLKDEFILEENPQDLNPRDDEPQVKEEPDYEYVNEDLPLRNW